MCRHQLGAPLRQALESHVKFLLTSSHPDAVSPDYGDRRYLAVDLSHGSDYSVEVTWRRLPNGDLEFVEYKETPPKEIA